MALNIKDPETDRLARELAAATGQPITSAIREAVREKLDAVRARRTVVARPELSDIIERGRSRPVLDARSEDEILGYGDAGLPR